MHLPGMTGNLAAAALLTKWLAWGWRLLPVRLFHPGLASNMMVLSKEAQPIPCGGIQRQLENNLLSGH